MWALAGTGSSRYYNTMRARNGTSYGARVLFRDRAVILSGGGDTLTPWMVGGGWLFLFLDPLAVKSVGVGAAETER